ncbi:unnamed protein product [Allacma fusca]|uniref:Ion transport domain-containing protein n=1 Tax=Allacma fusca TaxID=39272 RepID=A0A8J2Q538_9HEXA|nr:unnamed protein product [Allacma fusca]
MNNNSGLKVAEPQLSLRNESDEFYADKMAGLKKKFLYSLQNAPQVAWELSLQGVITDDETQSVLRNPIRQHQKEALFQIISHKKFKDIDKITTTLESTGNESLRWIMNFVKTQIMEAFPSSVYDLNKPKKLSFDLKVIDIESRSEIPVTRRAYRTPSQRKRKRRGINTFIEENQFLFESGARNSDMNVNIHPLSVLVHQAATDGDSEILQELFTLKPDLSPHAVDPENGRTPLHSAMLSPSRQNALKCVKVLIARFMEQLGETMELDLEQKQNALNLFLNHKDRQGLTVMHLAAESEYFEVIKYLYDNHRCDIFIRCKDGFTPLDVMYQKTPEAVVHFLNGALPTAYSHEAGNYTLEIDFSTVIGTAKAEDKYKHPETDMLAKLVFQNPEAAKIILPHVIVKTFLDLKWQKMKFWLNTSIIVQVLLLICYTSFVMQIFLVDCPYSLLHKQHAVDINQTIRKWKGKKSWKSRSTETNEDAPNTMPGLVKYLIGDLVDMKLSQFIVRILPNKTKVCSISIPQWVLLITFVVFGCFIVCKEVGEIIILNKIFYNGRRKRFTNWRNFWVGLSSYLNNVENIFQIIFLVLLFFQASLAFDYISELHYTAGALSIVVAWSLILMHFGNIYGLGTYVQILGKVIKIFLKIMGTYMVLIVAFAIAFSIMFPEMKQFKTFPKSFSRVIIMMTGELDYSATFYPNTTLVGPVVVVPVTAHIIFISFVLLLCVILINLLIGLTVYDIEGLRGKTDVILRSIQIEKLYVMESSLFGLNCIISWVRNAIVRLYDPARCGPGMYLDIFVVEPEDDEDLLSVDNSQGLHGMVVVKSIKEIPKKLQKEIRAMAEDVNQYVYTYLKK